MWLMECPEPQFSTNLDIQGLGCRVSGFEFRV